MCRDRKENIEQEPDMGAGWQGTFAIRWSQVVLDDLPGTPASDIREGATWRYEGPATRLDGPGEIMRLSGAEGVAELHRRAADKARTLCRRSGRFPFRAVQDLGDDRLLDRCFTLTDGLRAFMASWIDTGPGGGLVVLHGELPPAGEDLWVARVSTSPRAEARARRSLVGGETGFAAGTRIATPHGPRPAETLLPGDLVDTVDAGAQPLRWCGARRITGARLHVSPQLRPVRLTTGVLGAGLPTGSLTVAPNHRVLVTGPVAARLFAEPDVLVCANDLLALPGVSTDFDCSSVTYVRLMLDGHHLLMAEGMASESYRPDAPEADLPPYGRHTEQAARNEESEFDTAAFGPPVRRRLATGEAAILVSGML